MASLAKGLFHTTVRLEGHKQDGTTIVGTGFFFLHNERLLVITNKHVINGVTQGSIILLKAETDGRDRKPILGQGHSIYFNETNFIGHPDVDVAAMNISQIVSDLEAAGTLIFWKNITEEFFPTDEDINKFIGPLEEIIFIGYPSGIWDAINILPIARKGMTATPYYVDFEGQKKFLIDASVFPGSSGSPVFIYYTGGYPDKKGNLYAGNRSHFLGIVAQVYQRVEQGQIRVINIPTRQKPIAEITQMIDLGVVLKAETIRECAENYITVVMASTNQMRPMQ